MAIIDDLSAGKRENLPAGSRFYQADIRSGCGWIFEEFEPEVLSYRAAQIDVRRSARKPDFDADVNILGTLRLLQGNGVETSVNRLYELAGRISGSNVPARHKPAKPGKQLRSSVDPTRVSCVLNWHPEVTTCRGA